MKKVMASLLTLILAAVLIIPASSAAANGALVGEVQASVSFRDRPSTASTVIKYLKKGSQVAILEEVNSYWYKVQDNSGQIGYVSSSNKYIEIVKNSAGSGNTGSTGTTGNAVIVASVSFRTSPSTEASRIRYLSKGESVTITGQPNSYWYEVKDSRGVKGYVSSRAEYIQISGGVTNPGGGQQGQSAQVEKVITAGMSFLGTPYEFGSDRNTTATFDCSDFVRTAFMAGIGVTLPSDSRQQGSYVKGKGAVKTNWSELKRGDLMFFMSYKGAKASSYAGINKSTATITHVGIYLGDGRILHTYSKESGGVRVNDIAGTHWEHRFLFGGSAL
ncbi:C40 family peptidase [Paenibacillus oenotherae]|uniref:C40 family peptidase n=1 Tax=Paenibacillus oenotherae TaxID=1435645 RepID=A0ABS7DA47_9BACL|nr:SH3 domain-containing C40 family peptidase [Paenibacillus oenotherae]MBW7476810.1 C40 family peptidase [Paenibacillus oenotherae]